MTTNFLEFISQYGYLAVFLLVFLQEIGFPNPIPNEIVLLFSGFLSYSGELNFGLVIGSAIVGDIISSTVLFFVFYKFGTIILKRKPKWIPISETKIRKLSLKMNEKGLWAIFVGRVSPFIRGYVSVLSGLVRIHYRDYLLIQCVSAVLWALAYVATGYVLAYFDFSFQKDASVLSSLLWKIPLVMIVIAICAYLVKLIISSRNMNYKNMEVKI